MVDESQNGLVEVLGECDPLVSIDIDLLGRAMLIEVQTYPIQKKALTPEYLRDNVHLRARTANIAAMLRTRDAVRRRIDNVFEVSGSHGFHSTFKINEVTGPRVYSYPYSRYHRQRRRRSWRGIQIVHG